VGDDESRREVESELGLMMGMESDGKSGRGIVDIFGGKRRPR
jgi:hypothetical protein